MRHLKIFLSILILSLLLLSCKNKVEVVEPVDSDSLIASINNTNINGPIQNFQEEAGAPSLWQAFEAFFKACVKSSGTPDNSLFSKYRLLYLGPTNPSYLGAVYSHNGVEPKTELTDWISNDELDKFIIKGVDVPNCDVSQMKDLFISLALGKLPFSNQDSANTLKFILENKDTIINSVGMWTIDKIKTANFVKFLNDSSSNSGVKFYNDVMTTGNNVVAFQVVKVTGFAADISTTKDIEVGVNLDIPIMVTKTSSGSDSVLCSFKLNKTNNRTVHVASSGAFYAFALVMKGKKV